MDARTKSPDERRTEAERDLVRLGGTRLAQLIADPVLRDELHDRGVRAARGVLQRIRQEKRFG